MINREETLWNVIKSVTKNGRSIILTAVLAVIIIYLFSIIGYMCFQDDFLMEVEPVPKLIGEGSEMLHNMFKMIIFFYGKESGILCNYHCLQKVEKVTYNVMITV